MGRVWILRVGSDQQPDGSGGVMALVDEVAFGGEFGEKWTKGRGCGGRKVVFVAEVEIKPGPFVVVWTVGLRHPSPV